MKIPPTEEMVKAAWNAFQRFSNLNPTERLTHSIAAALAAAPTPPAQEAEPVAKIVSREGDWLLIGWLRSESCSVGDMLYTRPQSDELRKAAAVAAVEIGKFLDGEECSLDVAHENLRAALGRKL